jgi:hypothetical protein
MQRRNKINEQFTARYNSMLESPAFRVLTRGAHQFLCRLEIELGHHGGNNNGALPLTYQDLIDYGMSRNQIAAAMREAVALGFAQCTRQGRGGNADSRSASLWRITYLHDRGSRANLPTHEWRRVKTIEEAKSIARAARADKDPRAVMFGQRRKNRTRYQKQRPVPVSVSDTETQKLPVSETNTTRPVQKLILPSIVACRVGGRAVAAAGQSTFDNHNNQQPARLKQRPLTAVIEPD